MEPLEHIAHVIDLNLGCICLVLIWIVIEIHKIRKRIEK